MEYALIEIFTGEAAQVRGTPVYNAVLEAVRGHRLAARVQVYRGIAGAYEGGEFATASILDLSGNLPVKIEVLLPAAQVETLLPLLGDIVGEGVVAVRPLDVRVHRTQQRLLPRDLRVRDVMTPDPVAVDPETPVPAIVGILMERTFRSLPVLGPDRRVLGVVAEEDLITRAGLPVRPGLLARLGGGDDPALARLAPLRAAAIMTAPAVTIAADALVQQALPKLAEHRTLPVVDREGRLTGMISRLDVLRAVGHWTRSLGQWSGAATIAPDPQTAGDAVSGQGRSVSPAATLLQVAEVIAVSGIRRVAVVDGESRLVGIVAESDLLRALQPEQAGLWDYLVRRLTGAQLKQHHPALSRRVEERTAGEIMTTAMIVGQAAEPLAAAVERMAYHGLKELPLVDGEGRFVGFLSRRALLRAMAAGS